MKSILALLFSLSIISVVAQSATIKGTVFVNGNEGPIMAAVKVMQNGYLIKSTVTDFDGHFLFNPLKPGTYNIEISSLGFETKKIRNVVLRANRVKTLDSIKLEAAAVIEHKTWQSQIEELSKYRKCDSTEECTIFNLDDCGCANSGSSIGINKKHWVYLDSTFQKYFRGICRTSYNCYPLKCIENICQQDYSIPNGHLKEMPKMEVDIAIFQGSIINKKTKKPIDNCKIHQFQNNELIQSFTADSNGNFELKHTESGIFTYKFMSFGYSIKTIENLEISFTKPQELNIQLKALK